MQSYGATHCNLYFDLSVDAETKLNATYYDAELVFRRIAAYTNSSPWLACAAAAEHYYRDTYVLPSNGDIPGYWNFTDGLLDDYLATNDLKSKEAIVSLATYAAYARDDTPLEWTASSNLSREVAYTILSYINARRAGEAWRDRLDPLVEQALDHMDQWFVSQSAPDVRPFMVALTAEALIAYYDYHGPDQRVIDALITGLDWLWEHTWLPDQMAFMYTDRETDSGGMEPAPDLNLLIAPAYGWLYMQTGEVRFKERGDRIFIGGVLRAWLGGVKQFNQNYRWSFEYLKWRE